MVVPARWVSSQLGRRTPEWPRPVEHDQRAAYRGQVTEEFHILQLARDGYITGLNGGRFGSAGFVIVCGVAARLV